MAGNAKAGVRGAWEKAVAISREPSARRFLKFCAVGASGVVVNLAALALFGDGLGIHANIAAALAIELSIISNFLLNDGWTFSERNEGPRWLRMGRFHAVSLVGAAIQWTVFVTLNATVAAWILHLPGETWSVVTRPPDVGFYMYLSQLSGVVIATAWNFGANNFWTWRTPEG